MPEIRWTLKTRELGFGENTPHAFRKCFWLCQQAKDQKCFALEIVEEAWLHQNAAIFQQLQRPLLFGPHTGDFEDCGPAAFDLQNPKR